MEHIDWPSVVLWVGPVELIGDFAIPGKYAVAIHALRTPTNVITNRLRSCPNCFSEIVITRPSSLRKCSEYRVGQRPIEPTIAAQSLAVSQQCRFIEFRALPDPHCLRGQSAASAINLPLIPHLHLAESFIEAKRTFLEAAGHIPLIWKGLV